MQQMVYKGTNDRQRAKRKTNFGKKASIMSDENDDKLLEEDVGDGDYDLEEGDEEALLADDYDEDYEQNEDVLDLGAGGLDDLDTEIQDGSYDQTQSIPLQVPSNLQQSQDSLHHQDGRQLTELDSTLDVTHQDEVLVELQEDEEEDDQEEESRDRFRSERTAIVSLKSSSRATGHIPETLDQIIPIDCQRTNLGRGGGGRFQRGNRGSNRGGRGMQRDQFRPRGVSGPMRGGLSNRGGMRPQWSANQGPPFHHGPHNTGNRHIGPNMGGSNNPHMRFSVPPPQMGYRQMGPFPIDSSPQILPPMRPPQMFQPPQTSQMRPPQAFPHQMNSSFPPQVPPEMRPQQHQVFQQQMPPHQIGPPVINPSQIRGPGPQMISSEMNNQIGPPMLNPHQNRQSMLRHPQLDPQIRSQMGSLCLNPDMAHSGPVPFQLSNQQLNIHPMASTDMGPNPMQLQASSQHASHGSMQGPPMGQHVLNAPFASSHNVVNDNLFVQQHNQPFSVGQRNSSEPPYSNPDMPIIKRIIYNTPQSSHQDATVMVPPNAAPSSSPKILINPHFRGNLNPPPGSKLWDSNAENIQFQSPPFQPGRSDFNNPGLPPMTLNVQENRFIPKENGPFMSPQQNVNTSDSFSNSNYIQLGQQLPQHLQPPIFGNPARTLTPPQLQPMSQFSNFPGRNIPRGKAPLQANQPAPRPTAPTSFRSPPKRSNTEQPPKNVVPMKQLRFDNKQRKKQSTPRNFLEVQTVDTLPDTTTSNENQQDEEMEDEETREYRKKIEEQKRLREKLLREKEERRKQAALEKQKSLVDSQNHPTSTSSVTDMKQVRLSAEANSQQQTNFAVSGSPIRGSPRGRGGGQQRGRVLTRGTFHNTVGGRGGQMNNNRGMNNPQPRGFAAGGNVVQRGGRLVVVGGFRMGIPGPRQVSPNANSTQQPQEKNTLEGLVQHVQSSTIAPSLTNAKTVSVENLANSTSEVQLRLMCSCVGIVESVILDQQSKRATIRFATPESALTFVKKYQRKMVDLSLIKVSLIND